MNLKRIQDPKKRLRVYADTSVFGGCFDQEFSHNSERFFEEVRNGRHILIISDLLLLEIDDAPAQVKAILTDLPHGCTELVATTDEVALLRSAYIEAGVLPPSAMRDAGHIAFATISEVDILVSWNFKHIVHFEKIRGFNAVNLLRGYRPIEIRTPTEVTAP